MKNSSFLSENFQFLEVKFSIYLNRRVFVMTNLVGEEGAGCLVFLRVNTTFYLMVLLPKQELILVLFVRFFDLCLFDFVGFFFLLLTGKGCGL